MTAGIKSTPTNLPKYMDREGNRWAVRDIVRHEQLRNFYRGVRVKDEAPVVLHLSDFFRTEKG
jgi:hypothetical protein